MKNIIEEYIGRSISFVEKYKEYLMYLGNIEKTIFNIEIHPDMVQPFNIEDYKSQPKTVVFEQENSDGYMVDLIDEESCLWKPINSEITDQDIDELENHYSIKLPDDYKYYLKYKHFYQIFYSLDIKLYPNPKGTWIDILKQQNDESREYGFGTEDHFVIGEYIDYAYIAINVKNNKIEMLDWGIFETLPLADSFAEMLSLALDKKEAVITTKK